jgi:arginase
VGYSTVLDELNLSTVLKQDDPDIGILKNPRLVSETNKSLMNTINSHTDKGEFIVTIGGDHSLAIGTLSGTLNAVSTLLLRLLQILQKRIITTNCQKLQ